MSYLFLIFVQASPRSTPEKFTVDVPNENNRYDDLVDYNGRDIIISLPFKTTVYDIIFFAIVDTINGMPHCPDNIVDNIVVVVVVVDRVMGKVRVPSPPDLESHPIPPSRGQNQQWWPQHTPPTGTPGTRGPPYSPTGSSWGSSPTQAPVKLYELPNCREFLGRKVR